MTPLTPSVSVENQAEFKIPMQRQNWQRGSSALSWLPIQFISLLLKRQSQPVPVEKKKKKIPDPYKTLHLHAHLRTHRRIQTHTLYLQGSKHHHFLLRALNFLQQDGPLGLLIQLVHSDGIVLREGRGWGGGERADMGADTHKRINRL